MKIELKEITVRELANGYQDNNENGVVGYGGKTIEANCQMLCKDDNRRKSGK